MNSVDKMGPLKCIHPGDELCPHYLLLKFTFVSSAYDRIVLSLSGFVIHRKDQKVSRNSD